MNEPLAVIGGSGAYHLLQSGAFGDEAECRCVETPFGTSAPIHRFALGERRFLFLSRHGEADYSITAPYVNYRANLYALKECGVQRIVSWSGPGIINPAFRPGEFVLPHDIIDETRRREATFFKGRGHGFIRQNEPFCPQIQGILHETLHAAALPHRQQGVYVCTEGPRLESPAEIRKYRILGADLVGMTLAPEAFLARELEMCYAPICYLTNFAEGVTPRDYEKGALFEGMQTAAEGARVEQAVKQFPRILGDCWLRLAEKARACNCKDAMLRYKKKGVLGADWRSWIGEV
ncbi:MAG: MTAP family purine nucleoside phosphorylase [Nitrospinales bacterium]